LAHPKLLDKSSRRLDSPKVARQKLAHPKLLDKSSRRLDSPKVDVVSVNLELCISWQVVSPINM